MDGWVNEWMDVVSVVVNHGRPRFDRVQRKKGDFCCDRALEGGGVVLVPKVPTSTIPTCITTS